MKQQYRPFDVCSFLSGEKEMQESIFSVLFNCKLNNFELFECVWMSLYYSEI